jgi:hypothetical protein
LIAGSIAATVAPSQSNCTYEHKHKLALTMMAGVGIGVAGAMVIHAQEAKVAPAYIIAEVDVADPPTYQKYALSAPATLAPFNGRVIAYRGKTAVLEGEPPKGAL